MAWPHDPPFIRIFDGDRELGRGTQFSLVKDGPDGRPGCGFWTSAHLKPRSAQRREPGGRYQIVLEDGRRLEIEMIMCPECPDDRRPVRATDHVLSGLET